MQPKLLRDIIQKMLQKINTTINLFLIMSFILTGFAYIKPVIAFADPANCSTQPNSQTCAGHIPTTTIPTSCDNSGICSSTVCTGAGCTGDKTCAAGGTCGFIEKYVNPAIVLLTVIFGLIVVVAIIIGGIQYSTSSGDPQKAAAAKSRITKAIIAVVAYLFLFAALRFLVPGGLGK